MKLVADYDFIHRNAFQRAGIPFEEPNLELAQKFIELGIARRADPQPPIQDRTEVMESSE